MKYRDKLTHLMAGRNSSKETAGCFRHSGLQRGGALKSCQSEFHRILWCGFYTEPVSTSDAGSDLFSRLSLHNFAIADRGHVGI